MSLENLNKKFEYILIRESILKLQKDVNMANDITRQSVLFETYYRNFKIVSTRNLSWMKYRMPIFPGGNDHVWKDWFMISSYNLNVVNRIQKKCPEDRDCRERQR